MVKTLVSNLLNKEDMERTQILCDKILDLFSKQDELTKGTSFFALVNCLLIELHPEKCRPEISKAVMDYIFNCYLLGLKNDPT
jgi:hypothetical protein